MKKIISLAAVVNFFILPLFAQNPEVLNEYSGVLVPQLEYGKGKFDIYGIRQTATEKLTASQVPVFPDENDLTREMVKSPCALIHCLIGNSHSPAGPNVSTVFVYFINCRHDTILRCSSDTRPLTSSNDLRQAFSAAAGKALEVFDSYRYHFRDTSHAVSSSAVSDSVAEAQSDSIEWKPGKKLMWDDFKGIPHDEDPGDALTYTSNQTHFESYAVGSRFEMESQISCYFIKSKSWVKPGKQFAYLLNHEQKHFDLAEAGAREFRKRVHEAHFTEKNFRDEIYRIRQEVESKYRSLQQQYDKETDHSRKEEEQLRWNEKIDGMLKELEEFK